VVNKAEFDKPQRKSEKRAAAGKAAAKKRKPLKERIPVLPPLGVDPDKLAKPDQRAVAAVNMRIAGTPFHEIARVLEYASPIDAKSAVVAALSRMFPVEDWETLRQQEAMRAEQLLNRSMAMASADYFVDHDDPTIRIPNTERLRWHEQAGKDLALHATITGAKAPARMEITATTAELNQMVQTLLAAEGGGQLALEADVFADDIPIVEAEIIEEG
jgi:hypothetical protein